MVTEEEIEKTNEYSILLKEVDELEERWMTFDLNEGTELATLIPHQLDWKEI
jgi:hypothetical protein